MVHITQSESNEDSQGRQLRISKKLPTVCSGIRSRFAKPRPNLLSSKRGDGNVPATAIKSSKASQERTDKVTSTDKTVPGSDANIDTVSNTEKNVTKSDNSEISDADSRISKTSEENESPSVSSSDTGEIIQEDVVQNIPNTSKKKNFQDIQGISGIDAEKTSEEYDSSITSSINTINTSQDSTQDKISSSSSQDEVISNSPKIITINNSPAKNVPVSFNAVTISAQNTPEKERNTVTLNVTQNSTEKSSKYPHLTSILSKKRTEPKKEAQQKRWRKYKKGDAAPERSKMTMADLIYWNPAKVDEPKKSVETAKAVPKPTFYPSNVQEEPVDDVEVTTTVQNSVPRLVISEDGQINIDQSSLFVSRNLPQPIATEIVKKDDTTYSSFRKRPLTKHWTERDTMKFYKALSLVGADFSLMEQIFPHRTRRELKQKFKREEKFNIDLINRVLYESHTFDESSLNCFMMDEIDDESLIDDPVFLGSKENVQTNIKEKKSNKKEKAKKAKKVGDEAFDPSTECQTGEAGSEEDDIVRKRKKRSKKLQSVEDGDDDDDVEDEYEEIVRKTKKRSKKLQSVDDEEIENLVGEKINDTDTCEIRISKRKRSIKKLPDDFTDFDHINELRIDEESNDTSSSPNSPEDEEEDQGSDERLLTSDKKDDENNEYMTIEYIDTTESGVAVVDDVMAFEVVASESPVKKRKKLSKPIEARKTHESPITMRPSSYTSFTPV